VLPSSRAASRHHQEQSRNTFKAPLVAIITHRQWHMLCGQLHFNNLCHHDERGPRALTLVLHSTRPCSTRSRRAADAALHLTSRPRCEPTLQHTGCQQIGDLLRTAHAPLFTAPVQHIHFILVILLLPESHAF
jgi:hypothetical protein